MILTLIAAKSQSDQQDTQGQPHGVFSFEFSVLVNGEQLEAEIRSLGLQVYLYLESLPGAA